MFLLNRDIFMWDLLILLFMSLGLCLTILSIRWIRMNPFSKTYKRLIVGFLGVFGFVGFLLTTYGSFIEPHIVVTTRHSINFPTKEDLRIVVISDIHLGPYKNGKFLEKVVKEANATMPDIIILTGDYFYTAFGDIDELESLRDLHASLGVFAVFGNHDMGRSRALALTETLQPSRFGDIQSAFEAMGITVLRNENRILTTSKGQIGIAGVGDVWARDADTANALSGIPQGVPLILASHSPDIILDPRAKRAQLIVAGHTHGGQLRLPFIGPIAPIPTRLGNRFDQGLFTVDSDTTLAITRGVGESSPRARLFAWPEVLLLEASAN